MKFICLICFISIFQLFHSVELGGVKFAISEKMAYDVLYHFFPDIQRSISQMKIEDIHVDTGVNIREINAQISDFTIDKVKFKFRENGVNINISGLKGRITATIYVSCVIIPFHNNIDIHINNFEINANLRLFGKKVGNKLVPWAEFIEPPTHNINFDVDIDGFFFGLNGVVESIAKSKMKDKINDFFKDESNKFLQKSLNLIPTEIQIDKSKNLFLDFSLVDGIKSKNGYIEVNSYAFLYNNLKTETKNKKNYALSLVPPITTIDNPNQLFISQYSINSALYTYFITNPVSVFVDVEDYILGLLLPTLYSKYPEKKLSVYLSINTPPVLDFEQNYINGVIDAIIKIKDRQRYHDVFVCSIKISTKVEIFVVEGINVSGKINELNIEVGEISVNEEKTEFLLENATGFKTILLSLLNDYISKNIKFTVPFFFKNISVEHKSKYLIINYNLKKEVYFSDLEREYIYFFDGLKSLYHHNDYSWLTGLADSVMEFMTNINNLLFDDKSLQPQFEKIAKTAKKLPRDFNDLFKRQSIETELIEELTELQKMINAPVSLKDAGYALKDFLEIAGRHHQDPQNIFLNISRDNLVEYLAKFDCLIEKSVFNHFKITKKDVFIWDYTFDYQTCLKRKGPQVLGYESKQSFVATNLKIKN